MSKISHITDEAVKLLNEFKQAYPYIYVEIEHVQNFMNSSYYKKMVGKVSHEQLLDAMSDHFLSQSEAYYVEL